MKAIHVNRKTPIKNQPDDYLKKIDRLARRFPTPFMILQTGRIRHNLERLRSALPGIEVYYAVKANNHPDIIRTLVEEDCRFDISSAREIEGVMECGARVIDTIHTNPIKSRPEFDAAVAAGVATFVADNADELEKFKAYGDRAGVLLRFKTDNKDSTVNLSYKFGADISDIPDLLNKVKDRQIPFRGFCFHVGSQCTNPDQYATAIANAKGLIDVARDKGLSPEILDIGGGFPIEYTQSIPSIEEIGGKIRRALDDNIDSGIRVICEPGRFISADAITLFSSVIGKSVRDGIKWYYIDDGLYGSFSGRLFDNCEYRILTNRNTKWEKAVLAGPTCDSFDVIYKDCLMPPLDIGDILIFPAMGAYCSVSATDFNGLRRTDVIAVNW